jgi:peptide/nickel transport system substrate-binding protein
VKKRVVHLGLFLLVLALASACAPATGPGSTTEQRPPAARVQRTLVILAGAEVPSFATKALQALSGTARDSGTKAALNAELVYLDERGIPNLYLAEAFPELNTASWQLFPDGRMETTYRLKPNLTWHDGQPLTADDFVFGRRVYATPEFGMSDAGGFRFIDEVAAPDPRTVLIKWKERYALAGQVGSWENANLGSALPPLPRHILEQPFRDLPETTFIGLPFWSNEYVGAGPWKLDRREPGSFFEATAFDGFVFGRPKIDRIRVMYQPDSNVAVATLLSGEAHFSRALLHGEEGLALEQGWAGNHDGVVLWETDIGKGQEIQSRPEYAVPTQLATDVRVRQALAFAMDRVTLTDIVTAGHGLFREIYSHPHVDYFDTLLRDVPTRYSYDVRRAEQLLQEAGFSRGGDGGWLTPAGQRFTLEQWYLQGATNERDSQILTDGFRRFGIEASSNVFGLQRNSQEDRAKTPGMFGGNVPLPDQYQSRNVARPENRWSGVNRFGFTNPDLDRFAGGYLTALDRSDRVAQLAQMERVALEQVAAIPTYWTAVITAYASNLKGVRPNLVPEIGAGPIWDYEWES